MDRTVATGLNADEIEEVDEGGETALEESVAASTYSYHVVGLRSRFDVAARHPHSLESGAQAPRHERHRALGSIFSDPVR